MWQNEHSVELQATPEAVWHSWAEAERWPEWNAAFERIELRGPFEPGSTIVMTQTGQAPVGLRIAEMVTGRRFTDEFVIDGTTIRIVHLVDPLGAGRVRVTYRAEADGASAEEHGQAISATFPDALDALVQYLASAAAG